VKIDKEVVQRRVDLLEAEGTHFRTNVTFGADITLETLESEYDAVILCVGATEPRKLTEAPTQGVGHGMDYLTGVTRHVLSKERLSPDQDARDKDILVICGGETGADCVATALRQRCRSIVQFGKHEQPTRATGNM
jgi:glutamate synthase (NADPH/NADH) small chain